MLAIHVVFHNEHPLVTLTGALVLGDCTEHLVRIIDWLVDSGERHVMIDLRDVHTVDSSGLATLVLCHEHVGAADGDVVFLRPGKRLLRMLSNTRLTTVLRIVETGAPTGCSPKASHGG